MKRKYRNTANILMKYFAEKIDIFAYLLYHMNKTLVYEIFVL